MSSVTVQKPYSTLSLLLIFITAAKAYSDSGWVRARQEFSYGIKDQLYIFSVCQCFLFQFFQF